MSITKIKEKINLYLKLLGYTESDRVFLRGFDKDNEARKTSYPAYKINYKTLQEWNAQDFGVYIVVNGGGQTDDDVKHCRAIFYEHDNLPKEEQEQLWQKLNLPEPTFQIDTGGKSIHSYWVFDKPSPVEDWKTLQTDLLEFSDGDRSIKNPSRVMRLPGFFHQKTGNVAEIISQFGKRYSYQELRQIIPTQQTETLNFSQPAVAHLDAVPLENCLSRDDRALINSGEGKGKRNNSGAKLARSLIGAAQRLDYLGHPYRDDPRQLFDNYCSRCTPPIDSREAAQIWKSAQKDNPTATLTDDALENCIKAWQRQQDRQPKKKIASTPSLPSTTSNVVDFPSQQWDVTQVEQQLRSLAQIRPNPVKRKRELKKISQESGWKDLKYLKEFYQAILEEQDKEAELEDDIVEFSEILNSNEPLVRQSYQKNYTLY